MANLITQLNNYRLTTAEIIYHLPDHPQLYKATSGRSMIFPQFPELYKFLEFWTKSWMGNFIQSWLPAKKS